MVICRYIMAMVAKSSILGVPCGGSPRAGSEGTSPEGLARVGNLYIWYRYVDMLMCDMSIFGTWNPGISGTWYHGSIKWCHVGIMEACWMSCWHYAGMLDAKISIF